MNKSHLSIKQAADYIGVSLSTLYRWHKSGKLLPDLFTLGGHRRYSLLSLENRFNTKKKTEKSGQVLCYARVSTYSQKNDLTTQIQVLNQYCDTHHFKNYKVISDLGSGLNYNKKGLNLLIENIVSGKIQKIIITHKDRLLRFGYELIVKLCSLFKTELVIINNQENLTYEQQFCSDICEIMTVFSSRLYGRRSHKNKKELEKNKYIEQINCDKNLI